jgi:hypothetical protein
MYPNVVFIFGVCNNVYLNVCVCSPSRFSGKNIFLFTQTGHKIVPYIGRVAINSRRLRQCYYEHRQKYVIPSSRSILVE